MKCTPDPSVILVGNVEVDIVVYCKAMTLLFSLPTALMAQRNAFQLTAGILLAVVPKISNMMAL